MTFIDTRLDECVAEGFIGGPKWSTLVTELDSGREVRNAQWLYPRHSYSAQYINLSKEARDEVLAAFYACRGQLHAFRFKDWNDYEAFDEPLAPVAGTSQPVRLVKSYTFGSEVATRLIQAPVDGSVVVRANGTEVAGTLDATTGLFTPDDVWVSEVDYAWSGEFDVWVRFASDYNAFTIGDLDAYTADIELVEVRR